MNSIFRENSFIHQNDYNKSIFLPEVTKKEYDVFSYKDEEIEGFRDGSSELLLFKLYNNTKERGNR